MRKISNLKQKIILTFAYLAILVVFYFLNVPCLFLSLLKIPCPGCGMTRAILAAVRFDFLDAFVSHPMFWSMPILYAYFLLDNGLFSSRRVNSILLHLIGIGFLVQWIAKLLNTVS